MAITNHRTYDAQAVKASGVALGGATRITIDHGYDAIARQRFNARQGNAVISRKGMFVRGSLSCLDVTKFLSVLTAAPEDADDYLTFYSKQDGLGVATYHGRNLLRPRYTSFGLTVPEPPAPSSMEIGFECLWIKADDSAATGFEEVDAPVTASESAVNALRTNPELVGPVIAATFDGDTIDHRDQFGLRLEFEVRRARNTDFAGPDSLVPVLSGVTWNLQHKSNQILTTPNRTLMEELLEADPGDLVVTLQKINGAANKTMTLHNAMFTGDPEEHAFDNYGNFNPNGECETVDSDGTTHRTLSTNPIIELA